MPDKKSFSTKRSSRDRSASPSSQLCSNETFYRTLAEASRDFIFIIDREGTVAYANPSACAMMNRPPEKTIGVSLRDLFPREIFERNLENIEKALKTGKTVFHQEPFPFENRTVWLDTQLVPLKEGDGNVKSVLGISRDISGLKQAEFALREREETFRLISEQTLMGIAILQDSRVRYANRTLSVIFGFSVEEMLEWDRDEFLRAIHPEDRPFVREQARIKQTGAPGAVEHYSLRILTGKGVIKWVDHYSKTVSYRGNPADLVALIDITPRKDAEKALRYRMQFEQLISAISTEFVNITPRKVDRGIQKALERIGSFIDVDHCSVYTVNEDLTQSDMVFEWVRPGLPEQKPFLQKLELKNFPFFVSRLLEFENVYVPRVRDLPPEAVNEKRLADQLGVRSLVFIPMVYHGRLIGSIAFSSLKREREWPNEIVSLFKIVGEIFSNAIEHKRFVEHIQQWNEKLEQRVRERTRQLESSNRELEAFTFSVSHDLRAPLRIIRGYGAALIEDYADNLPPDGLDYLHRIVRTGEHMTRLIDGLLHLTGLSRTEMLPRKVDLGEMASAILDGFRESFPRKPVRFRIDEGLNAFGDPRLLRVMLENLLGNAWKFSLKKETVEIHFGRFEENGETRFFVRDNGAGFDMEYADKLFKVFQRLHSEEEFEGMGIGLATVKRIVNRHAGTIRAKGRVNEGAVFSFTLSLPRE